ncbi:unnamed protein product [Urochloa decumbens]|uniref:F-box domain-containing protein n=1 Tax=Urochloa decumbens TaxID=240449 RepID=A0ABC9D8Q0_9POAL
MSEGSMRRRLSSPAPLPDDDDLLREIFLRLPPQPSSLPRASLVCKRWGRIVSDPQFLLRFRAFHGRRQHPPLLGFFSSGRGAIADFTPTLDPPDRVHPSRLFLQALRGDDLYSLLGCRHGLALILNRERREIILWDPVARDGRSVAIPPAWFDYDNPRSTIRNAALLCDDHHAGRSPLEAFKVVLLRTDDVPVDADPQAFASLYESSTGVWSDLISVPISAPLLMLHPSVLVGNSFCWLLNGCGKHGILVFDLSKHTLAQIDTPKDAHITTESRFQILRMENGELGLAILSGVSMQLWERKASSNGGGIWMLQKTIELDKLLSLRSPTHRLWTVIHGYDEDNNVIFVSVDLEVYMIQLKSPQFKHLFRATFMTTYHPYTGFYTTARGTGSGDVGSGTLNNTRDCPQI